MCPTCNKETLTTFDALMVSKKGACSQCWKDAHRIFDTPRNFGHRVNDRIFDTAETLTFGLRNGGVILRYTISRGFFKLSKGLEARKSQTSTEIAVVQQSSVEEDLHKSIVDMLTQMEAVALDKKSNPITE